MPITDPEVEAYCVERAPLEADLLRRLAAETRETTDLPQMMVGPLEGSFLRLLVRLMDARRVLEIGTFTGYSALTMAEALPDDGEVVTCDMDETTTAVARRYAGESPHGAKVRFVLGDARTTVAALAAPFDLVFIDADKTSYAIYWELVLPKVRPGGLIVVDNTLWSGDVLRPGAGDKNAVALAAFNEHVASDPRVEAVLLPVRDGMTLAWKR